MAKQAIFLLRHLAAFQFCQQYINQHALNVIAAMAITKPKTLRLHILGSRRQLGTSVGACPCIFTETGDLWIGEELSQ